jgi:obscurin-RhoGEF protein
LIESETAIITNTADSSILKLVYGKLSDSGSLFFVKINNPIGESVSNKAKLNVSAGPAFIEVPKDQNTLRDKETRFDCVVTSNPKPTVSWFFNEKELTIKDGVRVEKDASKDKYSLVIPKTSEKNLGTYTVKAINEFGSSEKKCSLDILDLPKILNKLDNLTVNEKTSASFTVKFSGKPSPKTQWFKNDVEIEINELYELEQSVENQITLTIKSCISSEHTGSYYVKVSNEFGEVLSNKATLTINCK